MAVNLPTTLLRSFVAIVDAGTMLNAAEQVFLSQSALSLQIKRLEELVQQPLFTREGRRLVLTASGTLLLDYARRVLNLHDEALRAISVERYSGPVRIGMVQDFADTLLSGVLSRFAELHPDTQIFARVAGTAELQTMLDRDQLDLILGYAAANDPQALRVAPMAWFGETHLAERDIVPLAVLEKPCRFRDAAIASLEGARRNYRIAVETPNLSTLRASVEAGLGITCRTAIFLADREPILEMLPPLPDVSFIVAKAQGLDAAKARLATLSVDVIREL